MRMYETISPWFVKRTVINNQPKYRWVIFTYAGSSPTAFYPWANKLDQEAEVLIVNLPGRGSRMNEPLINDLSSIVQSLLNEIGKLPILPTIYFGYSLGSLIAYELCHQQINTDQLPKVLIVAAGSAPHKIGKRDKVYNLNEIDFWDKVKSYGGLPDEVLKEPELVKLIEPILRADFSIIDCYQYQPRVLLSIPIISIAGKYDKVCPPEYVVEWSSHTDEMHNHFEYESGHFFINEVGDDLIHLFNIQLNRMLSNHLEIIQ